MSPEATSPGLDGCAGKEWGEGGIRSKRMMEQRQEKIGGAASSKGSDTKRVTAGEATGNYQMLSKKKEGKD